VIEERTGDVESSVGDVDEMRSTFTRRVDDVLAECRGVDGERQRVAARTDDRQLELRLARLMSDDYTHTQTHRHTHTHTRTSLKPRPHQQQRRSNIVECYNVECCFDNVERCVDIVAVFGDNVEATFDFVAKNGNNVERVLR